MKWNHKGIGALLCLALAAGLLTGCGRLPNQSEVEEPPVETSDGLPTLTGGVTAAVRSGDGLFGVRFAPEQSMNPYLTGSRVNLELMGLIYESLFYVDERFSAQPLLCEDYEILDGGLTWRIMVKSGVRFSTGDAMTVSDVIYSIDCARNSDLYGGRLSGIESVSAALDEAGESLPNTLDISLGHAHGSLPVLLDVPIIPFDSRYADAPAGTGPYAYQASAVSPCLTANRYYWTEAEPPVDTIYLKETEELADAFSRGQLDVVSVDMTADGVPAFGYNKEIRNYDTTIMAFIGFNLSSPMLQQAELRQAVAAAVDREAIVTNVYKGNGVSAVLPLHPAAQWYDGELAQAFGFDMERAEALVREAKRAAAAALPTGASSEPVSASPPVSDAPSEPSDEPETILRFLVSSENAAPYESAVRIVQNLTELGFQAEIVEKEYADYVTALEAGDFDLYYGEVKLTADFDLTPLLSGGLNFGGVNDGYYVKLILDFLTASGTRKSSAANKLCAYILENAPLAVIGFKQHSVVTARGAVIGMKPLQGNLFGNVTAWTINLDEIGAGS